jgi:hypothetical protein
MDLVGKTALNDLAWAGLCIVLKELDHSIAEICKVSSSALSAYVLMCSASASPGSIATAVRALCLEALV